MSAQDERDACGAHIDAYGNNVFDHTCDDCMLPYNHYDPPELNDLDYDKTQHTEGTSEGTQPTEDK